MKIVDANVLLYAVNTTSEHHKPSLRWLDGALSGADRVGFAWVPLLAFVRLATKVGLFPRPLPREAAITQVADWLAAPSAVLVNPTVRHADILARMLTYVGTGANLVNDAHLAALAVEHRASIVSYDSDFGRFEGVAGEGPLGHQALLHSRRSDVRPYCRPGLVPGRGVGSAGVFHAVAQEHTADMRSGPQG